MRELALGARLTLAGGRTGLLRSVIAAVGVGLGVAVLLVAASIPTMHSARQTRGEERSDLDVLVRGPATVLVADVDTGFREFDVRGRLLEPAGTRAPLPPGVTRMPRPGEVVASPALRALLATRDGRTLLAPRIPGTVVGTIAAAGLLGPSELAYYAGARDLAGAGPAVRRLDHFGSSGPRNGLEPGIALLAVIVLVSLLLPVGVLVGAAVRTGGEDRDRRLAALRLVGADRRMARRIAAGEALVSAGLGLALGTLAFVGVRGLVPHVTLWNVSVYAGDVRPTLALALLVLAGVPVAAVAVTLLALRRVVAEPLGVVRRTESRPRRLWWRLLLPAAGVAALAPAAGQQAGQISQSRVAIGVIALLVGVAALLPWVVERAVGRLGAGKVAWQLAVRRLQMDPGGAARAVSGITVAVAGAIALQMVFAGVQADFETLRELVVVTSCADGDVFLAEGAPAAGRRAAFGPAHSWTVPADARATPARPDPAGAERGGVFATPGAVRGVTLPAPSLIAYVRVDPRRPDAVEDVRNAAASIEPLFSVSVLEGRRTDRQFDALRRGMFIGAAIVIALIGFSLLLTALEQVRERRRLLAVLVAFGTRRSTLSWSVLWQSAVPVGLGLVIAVLTGIALGAVLLRILGSGVHVAWADVAAMAGVGGAVVLLVTAATLPVLWKTMRPEGLRTE